MFGSELDVGADGELPEYVPIFPDEGHIKARDGREFLNGQIDDVIRRFEEEKIDIQIDVDHRAGSNSFFGHADNPAYGWIDKLEKVGKNGLRGHVKMWTDLGEQALRTKRYRYISPAFKVDRPFSDDDESAPRDGRGDVLTEVAKVMSVSLVNVPALTMDAVASAQTEEEEQVWHEPEEEELMDKSLLKLLGLAESASVAEAAVAIQDLRNKLETAEAAANPGIDLSKYAPIENLETAAAELEKVKSELETANAELRKIQQESFISEVDSFLSDMRNSKFLSDASVEDYKLFCLSSRENFEKIKSRYGDIPKRVSDRDLAGKLPGHALTRTSAKIDKNEVQEYMREYGLTEELATQALQNAMKGVVQ